MDVLLGNVESQHRDAAQLNTQANGIAERWVESCRRDLLDHNASFIYIEVLPE